jgi:hypothetical protein
MPIMDSRFVHQQPNPSYVLNQFADVDLSQFVRLQSATIAFTSPTPGQVFAGAALLALGGYALYKLCEPEPRRRRCAACGSRRHNVARCPHVRERQHFSAAFEKTGWCECCGYSFPKTQLHHYGGRADNSKAKEMCRSCHLHCGHSGQWGNFAINPRYCRRAA